MKKTRAYLIRCARMHFLNLVEGVKSQLLDTFEPAWWVISLHHNIAADCARLAVRPEVWHEIGAETISEASITHGPCTAFCSLRHLQKRGHHCIQTMIHYSSRSSAINSSGLINQFSSTLDTVSVTAHEHKAPVTSISTSTGSSVSCTSSPSSGTSQFFRSGTGAP